MSIRNILSFSFLTVVGTFAFGIVPAAALSTKECSVKYKAAKAAGTLSGETWNDFRKKECAAGEAPADQKSTTTEAKSPTTAPATASGVVFPKSVDAKYSKKTAGKARFYTCLDQYHANKATNGNGSLKWIQKGGGYYSECNKALKS